jgi:hypothetical protein
LETEPDIVGNYDEPKFGFGVVVIFIVVIVVAAIPVRSILNG